MSALPGAELQGFYQVTEGFMASKAVDTQVSDEAKAVVLQSFSIADLAQIQSFDDAFALAQDRFVTIISSEELGDGFTLTDKSELIGTEMLILAWRLQDKEDQTKKFGQPWVIVRAVTRDNRKVVFTDGSTGVRDQLIGIQSLSDRTGGIHALNGLRVSTYDYTDNQGVTKEANTFYIA
ncbi:hypothetical protein Toil_gp09 [Rhodococcus phage Toil]|uniref:Uncharacterized protein n=1 Tax=Rhodococcus phage Toil TaxID=1975614 RepID=A0A1W6DY58_9VIRU|nr:hypothetical protein KMD62_gp09 [Rhodococcus phage Toil]ARK07692.1 hypothetical protein Toil_gp09 [Rhodococcus phage Toil]